MRRKKGGKEKRQKDTGRALVTEKNPWKLGQRDGDREMAQSDGEGGEGEGEPAGRERGERQAHTRSAVERHRGETEREGTGTQRAQPLPRLPGFPRRPLLSPLTNFLIKGQFWLLLHPCYSPPVLHPFTSTLDLHSHWPCS